MEKIDLNINDLPPEILSHIFEYMSSPYVRICSEICVIWSELLQRISANREEDEVDIGIKNAKDLEIYATGGHYNLVLWALMRGATLTPWICSKIAEDGALEFLEYFYTKRFLTTSCDSYWSSIYKSASEKGHLHILEWAYEKNPMAVLTLRPSPVIYFMRSESIDVLNWAVEKGFQFNSVFLANSARTGNLAKFEWSKKMGCTYPIFLYTEAATGGQDHIIEFLHNEGVPIPTVSKACDEAIFYKHFSTLCLLRKLGFPWSDESSSKAAGTGDLKFYLYVIENGAPRDLETEVIKATQANSLPILTWMFEQGIPIGEEASYIAADSGNVIILEWLREKGLPLHPELLERAALSGQFSVFLWCINQGFILTGEVVRNAFWSNNCELKEWINEHANPEFLGAVRHPF